MKVIKIRNVKVVISKNFRVAGFYKETGEFSQDPLAVRSFQIEVNRWIREQREQEIG